MMTVVLVVGFSAIYPFDPALGESHKFERRFHVSGHFPFISSYLLLTPPQYDPKTEYPMVVALHGGHKRSLAAFVAAKDKFQEHNPAFVLMPMAQFRQYWAAPPQSNRPFAKTEVLPTAMEVVKDVIAEFSIDRDRVYVTGSSAGAVGTFAAMARHGDVFAAGVAVNGGWSLKNADALNAANLAIYQGTDDRIFPLHQAHSLVDAISAAGGRPKFVEMSGVGHDSWPAYRDPKLWDWLLAQSR